MAHQATRTARHLSPAVIALGLALLVGACSKPVVPPPPPTPPAMEAADSWWISAPDFQLSDYGSVEVHLTFEVLTGPAVRFTGDEGGADPADELQFWTSPSVSNPAVAMSVFPMGTFDVGEQFSWVLTFDGTTVAASETGFAVRPSATFSGTLGPDRLELVASEIVLVE